uniref:Ribosomal protein L11 n=1 Tax=Gefionella okellyi TaxID=2853422 RepID=A0A0B5H4R1_9EUKA|nr:ribosomal protein L11 [Gefionella okellyi]
MKNYKEIFTLNIASNKMNTQPPIGPMIGQRGLNIMECTKQFNNYTNKYIDEIPIKTNIIVFKNKTFKLNIKLPPISIQLKYLLGLNTINEKSEININYLYELINYNYNIIYKNKTIKNKDIILKKMFKNIINTLKTFNINIKNIK